MSEPGKCTGRTATEARRQASRRNGSRSRGPKTAEGKARSAQNARRHGLSRPAACDPVLAKQIASLARAIAGPDAGPERLNLACQIAAAQVEVMRVRRARAHILSAVLEDDRALRQAVALDRYEARACRQRKFAARQFDAAYPARGGMATPAAHVGTGFEPAPLSNLIAVGRRAGLKPAPTGLRYKGFRRTSPGYPRLFRAWCRPLEAVLAKQTRRAEAARTRQTNPTPLARIALDLNPEGSSGVARNEIAKRTQAARKSQTNPTPLAGIAPDASTEGSCGQARNEITKRTQAARPSRAPCCDRIPVHGERARNRDTNFDCSSRYALPPSVPRPWVTVKLASGSSAASNAVAIASLLLPGQTASPIPVTVCPSFVQGHRPSIVVRRAL